MTPGSPRGLAPDLFGQLAATDPIQRRTRRLFGRGRVEAVSGNQADLLVGYDAQGNALLLREVPIISGYVPRAGDWVAIQYEGNHAGAPWVAGPSMSQEATQDSAGIGVFPVSQGAPESPQASTVYFDEDLAAWRGYNGSEWVDFTASDHGGLGGLQGGAPGEYYHLTAAEYAGNWSHQLIATSSEQCPLEGVRMSDEVGIGQTGVLAKAISSGDMLDGFGSGYLFAIEDDAAVENIIAAIYGIRAGADNTGALLWKTATAGALTERMRLTSTPQLLGAVGSEANPFYSWAGRTADGLGSPASGELALGIGGNRVLWASDSGKISMGGQARSTGYHFEYRDNIAGALTGYFNNTNAAAGSTARFYIFSANASAGEAYFILRVGNDAFSWGRDGASGRLVASVTMDVSRTAYWRMTLDANGMLWLRPHAASLAANGDLAFDTARNALAGRAGDTNIYYAGTVKNVDSDLAEFESSGGLTQTMWSDTVDKNLWVTGKPINVFAAMRVQAPAAQAGANYSCTVEILLGTEVICGYTLQHTYGVGESSSYYYVELHSRVTKYAGTSLRNVASVKLSGAVAIASWSEGAHLGLTEYAEGRADPVTEDVTSANVTLQVRVTFSHSVAGLKCKLMDAGWGPETPVI